MSKNRPKPNDGLEKPGAGETTRYVPLGERLNQDVFHDNFVPKYSALARAPRTKLVLIGVWLIFLPMTLGLLAFPMRFLDARDDHVEDLLLSALNAVFGGLAVAILYSQTRRYLNRERGD